MESETQNDQSTSDTDKCNTSESTHESESTNITKPNRRFKLPTAIIEQLKDFPDVLEYIKTLQKYLEKQKKKVRRLKAKLKVSHKLRL